jgi:hypothetical protein
MILSIRPIDGNYEVIHAYASGGDLVRQGCLREEDCEIHQLQKIGDYVEMISLKNTRENVRGWFICVLCGLRDATIVCKIMISEFVSGYALKSIGCCERCQLGQLGEAIIDKSENLYIANFQSHPIDGLITRWSVIDINDERPARIFTVPRTSARTPLGGTTVKSSPGGGVYSSLLDVTADNFTVQLCDLQSPRPEYSLVYYSTSDPIGSACASVCMRDNQTCCITSNRRAELSDLRSLSVMTAASSKDISHISHTAFISENVCVVLGRRLAEMAFDIRYPLAPIYVVMCPYGYQIV